MPSGKTTTTTTTTTTTETKRITSLEPKAGRQLSSLEEAVVRMHHGVSVKADAQLPTNAVNDEVKTELLDMEVRAYEETGRADDLPDIPEGEGANESTARIVDALKNKS